MELWVFYFLCLIFFLLLVLAKKNLLFAHFSKIRKGSVILLIILVSFLGFVYWNFVPAVHRVYGDEPNLLSMATKEGVELAGDGALLIFFYYNLYEYIEPSNVLAIKTNTIISLASLLLLFVLVYMLLQSEIAALVSVMAVGTMGIFIAQSTNAYTVIWSLFFALLSSISFWVFIRSDSLVYHLLALLSVIFATMVRLEYFLLAPLYFVFWIFLKKDKIRADGKNLRYWLAHLTGWILLLATFSWIFFLNSVEMKISSASLVKISISNLIPTLRNIFIPSIGISIAGLFVLLLAIALHWILKNPWKTECLFLLTVASAFLLFYLFNVYYSPQFRVISAAYLAFVWGVPIELLRANVKKKWHPVIWGALIFVFLLVLSFNVMGVNAWTSYRVPFHYLSTYAPDIVHSQTNSSCAFITSYAPSLQMSHRMHAVSANDIIKNQQLLGQYPCWYFFEDYLCAIPKEKKGMQQDCLSITSAFNMTAELIITNSKLNYTLYSLARDDKKTTKEPVVIYLNTSSKTRLLEKYTSR